MMNIWPRLEVEFQRDLVAAALEPTISLVIMCDQLEYQTLILPTIRRVSPRQSIPSLQEYQFNTNIARFVVTITTDRF